MQLTFTGIVGCRMCERKAILAGLLLSMLVSPALVAHAQTLYNNGSDTGTYAWQINFGYSVTDSFVLNRPAQVDEIVLSIWDADDLNNPLSAGWEITTEPFGGRTVASGNSYLGLVQGCQPIQNQLCVWEMAIYVNANLPAGTYWLQVDNVQTRFGSDAFWGQSNGPSRAYLYSGDNSSTVAIRAIPSESFQVLGSE